MTAISSLRESNPNDAPTTLRQRLNDEGYLFFRHLQNPDNLQALRRDILGVCMAGGWLVPGTDPADGIAALDAR